MLDTLNNFVNIKVQNPNDPDQVEAVVCLVQRAWVETYCGLAMHRDTGAPLSREECRRYVNGGYRRRRLKEWTTVRGKNGVRMVIHPWDKDGVSCTDQVAGCIAFHGHQFVSFCVDPLFQGRGYGRRMFEAALKLGFGDRSMVIRTVRDSDAHRFSFPALGFIPTNREVPSWSSTDHDDDPPITLHQVELVRPAALRN